MDNSKTYLTQIVIQRLKAEVLTGKPASDNDAPGASDQFPPCGLLASAALRDEWEMAVRAGVDWIDLKNPMAGPLGRPDLELAKEFATSMQHSADRRWSIAGGELADWDSRTDGDFCRILGTQGCIKWALAGCGGNHLWIDRVAEVLNSLPHPNQGILVHYADWQACDAPEWESVLSAACDFRLRYVLIDTAIKDGRGLLHHVPIESLRKRVEQARAQGVEVAIAGALQLEQLVLGSALGAAWVGVRGAVCDNADRTSSFRMEKLERAVAIIRGSNTKDLRRESLHVLR